MECVKTLKTDEDRRRRNAESQRRYRERNKRKYLENQIRSLTKRLAALDAEEVQR